MSVIHQFGRLEVRPAERLLLLDGQAAKLGARAFDVLVALIERRERVVVKDELFDLVWPGLVVEENNLQVQISSLRKLLGPAMISTVPGRGYRFVGVAADAVAPAPAAVALGLGNLPPPLRHLLGRERDSAALAALLQERPLVTLVGAGGIGKTSLALAVAHELRQAMRGGAWWVELAALADPAQLAATIAQALGLPVRGDRPAELGLREALREQQALIVLDNCEHLLDATAHLLNALLAHAPGLRVLATSQSPLTIPPEHVYRLATLAVPAPAARADDAAAYGAVALFVERAKAADSRFALSPENSAAVIEICRQLDGIALAIELAAARVVLLGVNGLRDKLGERLRLLTGGPRHGTPRHQTLQAALDWSHSLLSPPEQRLLRRLGVFVGGFTLAAAQHLAAAEPGGLDEWAVLDHLGALVDKSLVAAEGDGPPRYRLLESTRAYAAEALRRAGEAEALARRHAEGVRQLFEQANDERFGEQGTLDLAGWQGRLQPELDNLRAALAWALGPGGDAALAVALAAASAPLLGHLGSAPEGLRPLLALRAQAAGPLAATLEPFRAALFWTMLSQLGASGRLAHADVIDALGRAEQLCRAQTWPRSLYRVLCMTAWALARAGKTDEAEALLPEIRQLEDAAWPGHVRGERLRLEAALCGERGRHEEALALLGAWQSLLPARGEDAALFNCIVNQCQLLYCLRRHEEQAGLARSLIERCAAQPSADNAWLSFAHAHVMAALTQLGELDAAVEVLREALPRWRRDGVLLPLCDHVALLLARAGRLGDAARLAAAKASFHRRSGSAPQINDLPARADLQQMLAAASPSPAELQRWQREGESLDDAGMAALCLLDRPVTL